MKFIQIEIKLKQIFLWQSPKQEFIDGKRDFSIVFIKSDSLKMRKKISSALFDQDHEEGEDRVAYLLGYQSRIVGSASQVSSMRLRYPLPYVLCLVG